MYNLLIFLHIISALLLSSFIIFPLVTNRFSIISGGAGVVFTDLLLKFIKIAHYALILLFFTGLVMFFESTKLSSIWFSLSFVMLIIIGAVIGQINKLLKQFLVACKVGYSTLEYTVRLRRFSWIAAVAVIFTILLMTNSDLFS